MPIFELDDGRPVLVQPMQPQAATFAQECAALLRDHLALLAGIPLFTVRSTSGASGQPGADADRPDLLALDAAGRPVVATVAELLDVRHLVTAMRHAGAAARLTAGDLARIYHSDPARFGADFATFRDQVPAAVQATVAPRLVLLCADVADDAADALAHLRDLEHVVVLQVGVVAGPDQRRYLDVAPLAVHEGRRRAVEPTALRLVHSREAVAGRAADAPLPHVRAAGPRPHSGELRSVEHPPAPRTGLTAPTPVVRTGLPLSEPTPAAPVTPARPDAVPAAFALGQPPVPPPHSHAQHAAPAPPVAREAAHPQHAAPPALPPTLPAAVPSAPPTVPAPPTHVTASVAGPVHPALAALAGTRRGPTALVWVRARRGQRFEATLRSDGLLALPDGSLHTDPDAAAARAIEAEGAVDGWRAWRLGESGPTLADAVGGGAHRA